MSEDDQNESKKDNATRKHKPDFATDKNYAPTGSVGLHVPTQGLGTTKTLYFEYQVTENEPSASQESEQAEPVEDTRPIAIETDDQEVNAQSEKDGFQLLSEDEIKAQANPNEAEEKFETPQISQSDYAKAFRRAHGQSNEQQKSKGPDLE